MSASAPPRRPRPRKPRSDGWTPERQLRFLEVLATSRSVRNAAAAAGMSRESAYRLRNRSDGTLFGLLWDRALAPEPPAAEGHTRPVTDGRIMRLLGAHFRRQTQDIWVIGREGGEARQS